jgi:murein DD-endopeptidase MepM/ murein hydrolase activator NlpD
MKTDRIELRVFIEGVLFPHVSSVTVNCGANEVATAMITVPPVPNIQFESFTRARVHVFYSDVDIRSRVSDDQWPLLFEGEITGDNFSKSPLSRHLTWRCSGYHSYWQQVLLSYYDPSIAGMSQVVNAPSMKVFLGNKELALDVGVAGANLTQRLSTRFAEDTALGYTSTVGSVFREALQVNHFFSLADEALKLSSRFLAPKDDKVKNLVERDHLLSLINGDITSVSGSQSMMDTLKSILSVMRYQLVVNPQPRLIPKDTSQPISPVAKTLTGERGEIKATLVSVGVKDEIAKEVAEQVTGNTTTAKITELVNDALNRSQKDKSALEKTASAIVAISNKMATKELETGHGKEAEKEKYVNSTPLLGQFLTVPDARFASVPRCNVIFPLDQTSLSLDRDLLAEPTRMFLQATLGAVVNKVYTVPANLGGAVAPTESVPAAVSAEGYSSPVVGKYVVTSGFGLRVHPKLGVLKQHLGIDLGAAKGTPIHAVAAGKVVASSLSETAGEFIRIDHGNGSVTVYMHMDSGTRRFQAGAVVKAGEVIGAMGKTGRVTGTHLHLDWIVGGTYRDPLPLLIKTSSSQTTSGGRIQLTGRAGPLPAAVEAAPVVEAKEENLEQTMVNGPGGEPLQHWKFLTPEEKIRGIVPIFDNDVASAHKAFETSNKAGFDAYMQNIAQSEFLWRRYLTRSMPSIDMPFNPRPVAGFPTLIVDNHRSIIGLIQGVSHTIGVGGGSGNATTSVSLSAPRFWDEGDPYHWRNGVVGDENRNVPVYYLDSMVSTNSGEGYDQTEPWPEGKSINGNENRDVDGLYRLLLGCPAVPYEYGESVSVATGLSVAVNKAIDGSVDGENRSPRTIVGHYQALSAASSHDAEAFARQFTARETVSERELMVTVLQSTQDSVTSSGYTGPAFRAEIQALTKLFTQALGNRIGHRG